MHPGFRPSLNDIQSQNHQKSSAFPQILTIHIVQIQPKSVRLKRKVIFGRNLSPGLSGKAAIVATTLL
jgi:hypothetical protein